MLIVTVEEFQKSASIWWSYVWKTPDSFFSGHGVFRFFYHLKRMYFVKRATVCRLSRLETSRVITSLWKVLMYSVWIVGGRGEGAGVVSVELPNYFLDPTQRSARFCIGGSVHTADVRFTSQSGKTPTAKKTQPPAIFPQFKPCCCKSHTFITACEKLGGLSGDKVGAVERKLGYLLPMGVHRNSLVPIIFPIIARRMITEQMTSTVGARQKGKKR